MAILLRQGFGVLKVSWAGSFLMAILFAALKSSAEMGNAAAYTGLAAGSIILMAWMLITAFATLGESIKALNSSVTAGTVCRWARVSGRRCEGLGWESLPSSYG